MVKKHVYCVFWWVSFAETENISVQLLALPQTFWVILKIKTVGPSVPETQHPFFARSQNRCWVNCWTTNPYAALLVPKCSGMKATLSSFCSLPVSGAEPCFVSVFLSDPAQEDPSLTKPLLQSAANSSLLWLPTGTAPWKHCLLSLNLSLKSKPWRVNSKTACSFFYFYAIQKHVSTLVLKMVVQRELAHESDSSFLFAGA